MDQDQLLTFIVAAVQQMEGATADPYQASFAGGGSGLSFGTMQLDVANNPTAALLFSAIMYSAQGITGLDDDEIEHIIALASTPGVSKGSGPGQLTADEVTAIDESLEAGAALVDAGDQAQENLVIGYVESAFEAAATNPNGPGELNTVAPNAYFVTELAEWANQSGDLGATDKFLKSASEVSLSFYNANYLSTQRYFAGNQTRWTIYQARVKTATKNALASIGAQQENIAGGSVMPEQISGIGTRLGYLAFWTNSQGSTNASAWTLPMTTPGQSADLTVSYGNTVLGIFAPGTWSQLSMHGRQFSASFIDASHNPDGSLTEILGQTSNTVILSGVNRTDASFQIANTTQIHVSLAADGAISLRYGDPEQIIMSGTGSSASGNETVDANIGGLTLDLGTGTDTLLHLGAGSTVDAGDGNYAFTVSDSALTFSGNAAESISLAGTDFTQNGAGGQTLDGSAGKTSLVVVDGDGQTAVGGVQNNNIFIAADNSDTLWGGSTLIALGNNDVLSLTGNAGIAFDFGNNNTLLASGTNDVLVGNGTFVQNGQDQPSYTALSNTLLASGAGNDTLFSSIAVFDAVTGNAGSTTQASVPITETMDGGSGNDTFYAAVTASNQVLTIDGGSGHSTANFSKVSNAINATIGFGSNVTPSAGSNVMLDNIQTIIGSSGNDTFTVNMTGATGPVVIEGGGGQDTLYVSSSSPVVIHLMANASDIEAGKNVLNVYGVQTVFDANGNDTVDGGGNAAVYLGNGNDVVNTSGTDTVYMGNGNDTLLHAGAGSIVNAGQGVDSFQETNDVLISGATPEDLFYLGTHLLTGGITYAGQQSPWSYDPYDGMRYGIDTAGELQIVDPAGDTMYVAGYTDNLDPSQDIGHILLASVSLSAYRLLDPNAPIAGWQTSQFNYVNALSEAYFGQTIYGGDPVVLDLTGAGINLTAVNGVSPSFDLNDDGFAVQSGWVEPNDAILVLDPTGAPVENASGFISLAQLAAYDVNGDGVIDASDPVYSELRLWVGSNGGAGSGTLETLQQAGIASISLASTAQSGDTIAGNAVLATGSFTFSGGGTGDLAEVAFATDDYDTTYLGNTAVSAAAAALPDEKGYGTLSDLRVAMTNDPALADPSLGPSLISVVSAVLPSLDTIDLASLRSAVTPILTAWAQASQIINPDGSLSSVAAAGNPDLPILVVTGESGTTIADFAYEVTDAEGSYWVLASGDSVLDADGDVIARPTLAQVMAETPADGGQWTTFAGADLDFMERYLGTAPMSFTGVPEDPSAALAALGPVLSQMYDTLDEIAVSLAMQGPLASYFPGIAYDVATNAFQATTTAQLTPMYEAILQAAPSDAAGAVAWLEQWEPILEVVLGNFGVEANRGALVYGFRFANLVAAYEAVGLPIGIVAAASALGIPSAEIVTGGSVLTGDNNGDIFYLSAGNQTAIGGLGPNNFVAGGHFGDDTIWDDEPVGSAQNPNTLRFATLASTDITASRQGLNLILSVDGTGQQITVENEFIGVVPGVLISDVNDYWGVQEITFADGVVWQMPDIAWAVEPNTNGVDGTLIGTPAMDVLNGGNGNHFLSGEGGGDIYLYGTGDGNDTIEVASQNPFSEAPNIVSFGAGIDENDVVFTRNGGSDDLLITFQNDPGDSLLIEGQFQATFTGVFGTLYFDQIQEFRFGDGTILSWMDVDNLLLAQEEATPGAAIYGYAGVNEVIDPGIGGNHFMSGGDANDTYVFGLGYGNDTIFQNGTNILAGGNDTVLFNPDVDPSQVQVVRQGDSDDVTLVLSDGSTLDIQDQFFEAAPLNIWFDRIDTFQFQNAAGTVWTYSTIEQMAIQYEIANGNHTVFGTPDNDYIDPGVAGNDYMSGGNGNDTYVFGEGYGHDTIYTDMIAGGGNDTVLFNPDVDPSTVTFTRGADPDTLMITLADGSELDVLEQFGLDGFEAIANFQFQDADQTLLTAAAVQDAVLASEEAKPDSVILGFFDGATLDGFSGNDTLVDQGGANTFVFGLGYGHEVALNTNSGDVIQLGAGITPDMLVLSRDLEDATIGIAGTSDTLTLPGFFGIFGGIAALQFADGTSWSLATFDQNLLSQEDAQANGIVYGDPGGATLNGFGGNDTLDPLGGANTFVFGIGYGHEVALDTDTSDVIELGPGVTADMLVLSRDLEDATIGIAGTSDTLTLPGFFGIFGGIGSLQFADGTSWSLATFDQNLLLQEDAQANGIVYGDPGGATLNGFGGNDTLEPLGGANTFVFGIGYGREVALDTGSQDVVQLGAGVAPDMLVLSRDAAGDVTIGIAGTSDTLSLPGFFDVFDLASPFAGIGALQFADGTSWSLATFDQNLLLQEEAQSDGVVYAYAGGITLDATGGDDTLVTDGGGDTVVFGLGYGQELVSSISRGESNGVGTVQFGAGITPAMLRLSEQQSSDGRDLVIALGNGDALTLQDEFGSNNLPLATGLQFQFADGTVWGLSAIEASLITEEEQIPGGAVVGFGSGETLDGFAGNETLIATGGGDTFVFGRGYGAELVEDFTGQASLLFTAGTSPADVTAQIASGNLVLSINGTNDQVTVSDYFSGGSASTQVQFADGTVWSYQTLLGMISAGRTLISGNGIDTLVSNAGGNVLSAQSLPTVAWYGGDYVTVNLPNGTAGLVGAAVQDIISGISAVVVAGTGDLAVADTQDTLIALGAGDALTGSGNSTLIARGGRDTLSGEGGDTLIAAGAGDTLFGSRFGDTLIATNGSGALAVYEGSHAVVDLATGTAGGDTLLGIAAVSISGSDDTLIAGGGNDTLSTDGFFGTLIGGSGVDTLSSTGFHNTLIGGSGTEILSTSGSGDTLIGGGGTDTLSSTSTGSDNVLIGGSGTDTLSTLGVLDTLIGGSGADTLLSGGVSSVLIANGATDLLVATAGDATLLAGSGADTLLADGGGNVLFAGSGADILSASGGGSTLIAGSGADTLLASGSGNTLFAGTGADTLVDLGSDDTLIGTASGSTLVGSAGTGDGTGTALFYAADDLTVNLAAGTAGANGSATADSVTGIANVTVSGAGDTVIAGEGDNTLTAAGSRDTLIGGPGTTTLLSDAGGNVLQAGGGPTLAFYAASGVAVDLSAGTASVAGSGASDSLSGITAVELSSVDGTVIGGSGNDTLISTGSGNTLMAGGGDDTLISSGIGDTLLAGSGSDTLVSAGVVNTLMGGSGSDTLLSAGSGDTLIGGGGIDTLASSGSYNTLIAGTGADLLATSGSGDTLIGSGTSTLIDTGTADTLFGSALGDTLIGTVAGGTTAAYAADGVVVDLAAGTAQLQGTGVGDTLSGIDAAMGAGTGDTLIANSGADTLTAAGMGDTLIGGSGGDTLASDANGNILIGGGGPALALYAVGDVVVDLSAGTATVLGSGINDALSGIAAVEVTGADNTVIGGALGDTLIDGGSADTLVGTGGGDTLVGNGVDTTAVYAVDDLAINLAAGSAGVSGSGTSDSLSGIEDLLISGQDNTFIADSGSDIVTSAGSGGTFIGGAGSDTFTAAGSGGIFIGGAGSDTFIGDAQGNTLIAGSGRALADYADDNLAIDLSAGIASVNGSGVGDALLGIASVAVSGNDNTLIAGNGADTLAVTGSGNTLIAGSGSDTLWVSGAGNTLIGGSGTSTLVSDASGNTLIAGSGPAIASYSLNNNIVDLATGTAGADTLIGIAAASISGSGDTLIAGSGTDTLTASGSFDVLLGGSGSDTLLSSGRNDRLTAGSGPALLVSSGSDDFLTAGSGGDTLLTSGVNDYLTGSADDLLVATGTDDQLQGAADGDTLIGTGGVGAAALYTMNDVAVDLSAGTAGVVGSGSDDTLIGIDTVQTYGSNDTLIGGSGDDALVSEGAGTLIGGTGHTVAVFAGGLINLSTGIATGDLGSNTLIGIDAVSVIGADAIVIGGSGPEQLSSTGFENTLIGGSGAATLSTGGSSDVLLAGSGEDLLLATSNDGGGVLFGGGGGDTLIGGSGSATLVSDGGGNTLVAGSGQTVAYYAAAGMAIDLAAGTAGSDSLIGITDVVVAGDGATLIGGAGADTLSAQGAGDTLVAGGPGTTLISNAAGNTLEADGGGLALYTLDQATIDLASGMAGINGASVDDTLIGVTAAAALGTDDTLIGGSGTTTLASDAAGNTLVAGSGTTVAFYAVDGVTVDLATATAAVNGASIGDTLVGIAAAAVAGTGDTLIGGGAGNVLAASGSDDTVLGAGDDTLLISSGTNTFFGGGGQDTFEVLSAAFSDAIDQPQNLIADFDPSRDTIDLSQLGAARSFADLSFASVTIAGQSYLEIGLGSGQALLLAGVAADQLTAGNFVFPAILPPQLLVQPATGATGSTIPLHISVAPGDPDIDESLSVTIGGLPAGASLSAGTQNSDGSWTLTAAQLSGLTLTPPPSAPGDYALTVTAVATDLDTGKQASSSATLALDVAVSPPTLTVEAASGNAATAIPLDIAAALTDTGSAESLSVKISGLPAGARLSAGTQNSDGSWTLTPAQLAALTLTSPLDSSGDFTLTVTAIAAEQGQHASTSAALALDIAAVASPPSLTLQPASGFAGTAIPLGIATAATDSNGQESLSLNIGGLPAGASLSAGTENPDGSWTLSPAQLVGLSLTVPDDIAGDVTLTVSSTATESSDGSQASTSADLALTVFQTTSIAADGGVLQAGTANAMLLASGSNDTLIGGAGTDVLASSGSSNTLIAGTGIDTLVSSGVGDTLIGAAAGDTLISTGTGTVAAYTLDDVTVDLGAGVAVVAGATTGDTLTGIASVLVTGTGDTVIAGSGAELLSSAGSGNTLIAGGGADTLSTSGTGDTLIGSASGDVLDAANATGAVALYTGNDIAIDLAQGTAIINGASLGDTLIGITAAAALGTSDTLIGGSGSTTLISDAGSNTLISGGPGTVALYVDNNVTVDLSAGTAVLAGAGTSDTLIGVTAAEVDGSGDIINAGGGAQTLLSGGSQNTLIGGSGPDTLASSGFSDTLMGGSGAQLLLSSGEQNTLLAGSGADTLSSSGVGDLLIAASAADTLSSSGTYNTLVAGSGAETLLSSGTDDTLLGNAGGATLISAGGTGVVAGYAQDGVSVNLAAGTAIVNGSSTGDTLIGIGVGAAFGANDTLIGGSGSTTLMSDAGGNTLVAGGGGTVALYGLDNLAADLATGTAMVEGSSASDVLIGITAAEVDGSGDTLIGDSGADTLTSNGFGNTLIGGSGADTLASGGFGDTLIAGGGPDTLLSDGSANTLIAGSGADVLSTSGTGDTLIAGSSADTLISSGTQNTLIGGGANDTLLSSGSTDTLFAGSGGETLLSSGTDDSLFGSAEGATLISSNGTGTVAAYALDGVLVDLASATAALAGASVADTLIGIAAAAAFGVNDTLIGAGSGTTLMSDAGGNTLVAGAAGTVALYAVDNVTVDLTTQTAAINGASTGDRLVGITIAEAAGANDTLIGGSGSTTLIGNAAGDTLAAGGTGTVALYAIGGVAVDLSAGLAIDAGTGTSDTLIGISAAAAAGSGDTLIGGGSNDTLSSSGLDNTLVAGSGAETLLSSGTDDTLLGSAGGATLISAGGTGVVAGYAQDGVSVNLAAGTAIVNGSSTGDTLIGIGVGAAFGANDTLIGGSGSTTLMSDAGGNTLVAGGGGTVALYGLDNLAADLATGTAMVEGSSASDVLIGITAAEVDGSGDTLIGDSGADTLTSNGFGNTLIGGSGADTLASGGFGDTLIAGGGPDTLLSDGSSNTLIAGSGADVLSTSGTGDTLIAGSSADTLISSGTGNTLIAGSGSDTLSSTGSGDTLIGGGGDTTLLSSAGGNTLIAGTGQTVAVYTVNNVTVDLATGTASVNGSGTTDALDGIIAAAAFGADDTLIGGSGTDTLISDAGGNTLISGSGEVIATYAIDDMSIDLATGTASVVGASTGDTLIGVTAAAVSGSDDTVIAGDGAETLFASGLDDILFAGDGADALFATGIDDTLFGNLGGSLLDGSGGLGTVVAYALNDVTVDLATGTASASGASSGAPDDTLVGIAAAAAYGTADTLIGASSGDVLSAGGSQDVLVAGGGAETLSSSGSGNTLIAGTGTDTLSSSGSGDTLASDAGGNTLISTGTHTVAFYGVGNLTVDLATGTAAINGASAGDTLIGFLEAMVTGAEDTVIAGSGRDTLIAGGSGDTLLGGSNTSTLASNAAGNTLIAGTGRTVAFYGLGGVTVDLATGTASVNGAAASDTLVGITDVVAAGSADTLIADAGGTDTLTAAGSGDTLLGGSGTATLASNAGGNTLEAGSGLTVAFYSLAGVTVDLATGTAVVNGAAVGDTLLGITDVAVSGSGDTGIAGAGTDLLTAKGKSETLIGGSGTATLSVSGSSDLLEGGGGSTTLVGDFGGNTLEAGSGKTTAFYSGTGLVIDLATGQASRSGASDTLVGITSAAAHGANDTLIAGAGDMLSASGGDDTLIASSGGDDTLQMTSGSGDTLAATVGGNTLIGLSGQTVAFYAESGLTVDLLTGQVSVNAAGTSDTLAGITDATVTGSGDTLIADGGTDILSAIGSGDTLLGGSGTATLVSNAGGNTLIAGTGRTVAFYGLGGATVDLATGRAAVNGAAASDTLVGITNVVAAGSGDTLIADGGTDTLTAAGSGDTLLGGSGTATLISNAGGNTLEAGSGLTQAFYSLGSVTVDLATGTAAVSGSSVTDLLIGIADAAVSGSSDTVIAGTGTDMLTAKGESDTLIGGGGTDTLSATGSGDVLEGGSGTTTLVGNAGGNTLIAGTGETTAYYTGGNLDIDLGTGTAIRNGAAPGDTLIDITDLAVAGSSDILIAGGTFEALAASGGDDTLIASSSGDDLLQVLSGDNDTLVATVGGNTLSGGTGSSLADYLGSGLVLNLAADTVTNGSGATDRLVGITRATVSGSNDTLIADSGTDTLSAGGINDTLIGGSGTATLLGSAGGDTLEAGTGRTIAYYAAGGLTVDLATGTAAADGASGGDTLIGITNAVAAGADATLIAGSGTDTLTASGSGSTLVAGAGTDRLVDNGTGGAYEFGRGDGKTTIANGASSNSGPSNELNFGTGISDEQLWFKQSGNNLQIDLMGTSSQVTVAGWFSSTGNQLQEITAGGLEIDSQVSQLVQAMATYAADNPGFNPTIATQAPNDPTLQSAIAAAWHH